MCSMILGTRGIRAETQFRCCDCGDVTTGKEVIEGTYLYIVRWNRNEPLESVWRCECCQDDWLEQQQDC